MRRRDFIGALGAAATPALWARVARAQQSAGIRQIGVLVSFASSDAGGQARIAAFRDALQALGWKEASNINITIRWGSSGAASIQQAAAVAARAQGVPSSQEADRVTACALDRMGHRRGFCSGASS